MPSHNAREYCRLSILRLGQTTPQRRRQRRLPSPQHRRQGAPPPHRTPHASLSRSASTHPWWHHQPHCHSHQGNQDFCQQGRVSILHKSNIASHTIRSQKRTNTYPSSQVGTRPSAGKNTNTYHTHTMAARSYHFESTACVCVGTSQKTNPTLFCAKRLLWPKGNNAIFRNVRTQVVSPLKDTNSYPSLHKYATLKNRSDSLLVRSSPKTIFRKPKKFERLRVSKFVSRYHKFVCRVSEPDINSFVRFRNPIF